MLHPTQVHHSVGIDVHERTILSFSWKFLRLSVPLVSHHQIMRPLLAKDTWTSSPGTDARVRTCRRVLAKTQLADMYRKCSGTLDGLCHGRVSKCELIEPMNNPLPLVYEANDYLAPGRFRGIVANRDAVTCQQCSLARCIAGVADRDGISRQGQRCGIPGLRRRATKSRLRVS